MHENANLRNQLSQTWNQIHKQTKKIEAERSVFLEELERVRQSVNFADNSGRRTPQVELDQTIEPLQRTISPLRATTDVPFSGQVHSTHANVISGTGFPDMPLSKTRISAKGKSPTGPSRQGPFVSSTGPSSTPSLQNIRPRRTSAPRPVVSGSGPAPRPVVSGSGPVVSGGSTAANTSISQQSQIPTSVPSNSVRPLNYGRVSTQPPSEMQSATSQQVTRSKRLSPVPTTFAKPPSPTKNQ